MDQDIKIPVAAGVDLSGSQYKAIEIDGTLGVSPATSVGILQNKPQSGEQGALTVIGRSKFQSGGTITVGGRLTVSSGGFMTATGSGDIGVGFALAGVASGGIAEGVFNFANQRDLA